MSRDKIRLGGSIWESRKAYVDHLLKMNADNPEYDKGDQPMISKSTIANRAGVTPQCVNWCYNNLVNEGMEDYYKTFKDKRKAKNDLKYKKVPVLVDGKPRGRGRPPKAAIPQENIVSLVNELAQEYEGHSPDADSYDRFEEMM